MFEYNIFEWFFIPDGKFTRSSQHISTLDCSTAFISSITLSTLSAHSR